MESTNRKGREKVLVDGSQMLGAIMKKLWLHMTFSRSPWDLTTLTTKFMLWFPIGQGNALKQRNKELEELLATLEKQITMLYKLEKPMMKEFKGMTRESNLIVCPTAIQNSHNS
ncbi:hypothetical protein H5410_012538 [Solanum commersonii]|uniref:Uncharacterized protein n=1 Tax=Solanum commersonii TaxID=4109 RepID=A0A9J6ART5_SOLCO|nr:hypothetical protein H5410_012538 [Solanum commersonii]